MYGLAKWSSEYAKTSQAPPRRSSEYHGKKIGAVVQNALKSAKDDPLFWQNIVNEFSDNLYSFYPANIAIVLSALTRKKKLTPALWQKCAKMLLDKEDFVRRCFTSQDLAQCINALCVSMPSNSSHQAIHSLSQEFLWRLTSSNLLEISMVASGLSHQNILRGEILDGILAEVKFLTKTDSFSHVRPFAVLLVALSVACVRGVSETQYHQILALSETIFRRLNSDWTQLTHEKNITDFLSAFNRMHIRHLDYDHLIQFFFSLCCLAFPPLEEKTGRLPFQYFDGAKEQVWCEIFDTRRKGLMQLFFNETGHVKASLSSRDRSQMRQFCCTSSVLHQKSEKDVITMIRSLLASSQDPSFALLALECLSLYLSSKNPNSGKFDERIFDEMHQIMDSSNSSSSLHSSQCLTVSRLSCALFIYFRKHKKSRQSSIFYELTNRYLTLIKNRRHQILWNESISKSLSLLISPEDEKLLPHKIPLVRLISPRPLLDEDQTEEPQEESVLPGENIHFSIAEFRDSSHSTEFDGDSDDEVTHADRPMEFSNSDSIQSEEEELLADVADTESLHKKAFNDRLQAALRPADFALSTDSLSPHTASILSSSSNPSRSKLLANRKRSSY